MSTVSTEDESHQPAISKRTNHTGAESAGRAGVTDTSSMEIVTTPAGVTELRRHWSASDSWAAALIVHGLGEHSGRYERVGARFASAGIDTRAFDLQGFGCSAGARADIRGVSIYLAQILDNLIPLFATGLPVVLVGHSIGGLLSVAYMLSRYRPPDLVVLNSPALDAVVPAWKRISVPVLARHVPRLKLKNPVYPDELFTDPAMAEDYRTDPLVQTRTTVRLGAELLALMDRVGNSLDRYTTPTLLLHGAADTVVPVQLSETLGARSSVDRVVYPALRHGAINEAAGNVLIEGAVRWIRARVAATG